MVKECLTYLCGTTNHSGTDIDMVSLWTFSLVLATLLLYLVARHQLSGIKRTAKADFIKQFNNDFFVESTRNVVMLLDCNALDYKEKVINCNGDDNVFPYFEINDSILSQFKLSDDIYNTLLIKKVYTSYEIDDLLLGRFEDIGLFLQQGFLNRKDVRNHFSWYIHVAWENAEIQKYIVAQRNLYGSQIYNHFEYVYNKCANSIMLSKICAALKQRMLEICR